MLSVSARAAYGLSVLVVALVLPGIGSSTVRAQIPTAETPTTAQSALRQGLKAYQEGRYSTAVSLLQTATEAGILRPQAYAVLSLSLLRTDQPDRAEQVIETGVERLGTSPLLRLARAEVRMHRGALTEALAIYQDLEAAAADSSASRLGSRRLTSSAIQQRLGQLHQQIGSQAFAAGDTVQARRHLEAARQRIPNSPAVYSNLGVLHLKQGRVDKALAMARRGLSQSTSRSQVRDRLLRLKASALQEQGKADAVVPVYQRLAKRNPNDVGIQVGYAQALIDSRAHRKGMKQFRTLLDRFPDNRRVYEALIDIYDRFRNVEGALHVLRRMQHQFPEDPAILRRVAERLVDLRRYADARAAYDSVLTRTGDTLEVAQAVAQTFEAQDSLAGAAVQYRRALRQQPSSDALYRDLGRVLEESGQWTEALAAYRRWETRTGDAASFLHQGRAFEHLREPDSAMAAYRETLTRANDHPFPHSRLADLYWQRGRSDLAFEHAVDALRLGLEGDAALSSPPDSNRAAVSGYVSAQQRRRRRANARRRSSVDHAFRLLTRAYSSSRVARVLDNLLAEYPQSGRLHFLVGTYYHQQDSLQTARHHLRQAAELMPYVASVHRMTGQVAAAQGDTTAAIRAYERAVSVDTTAAGAYGALIELYRNQGRLDALIRRWRRRYDTRPTDALREALLEAYHKAGRYEAARTLAVPDSSR
jgi:tetratricopeptide (TPR) repeat protein